MGTKQARSTENRSSLAQPERQFFCHDWFIANYDTLVRYCRKCTGTEKWNTLLSKWEPCSIAEFEKHKGAHDSYSFAPRARERYKKSEAEAHRNILIGCAQVESALGKGVVHDLGKVKRMWEYELGERGWKKKSRPFYDFAVEVVLKDVKRKGEHAMWVGSTVMPLEI